MLNTEQKSNLVYKRHIGVADTRSSRDFYEEAIKSSFYVRPDQLLMYGDQIPKEDNPKGLAEIKKLQNGQVYGFTKSEGEEIGIVKYYEDYPLQAIDAGTDNAFKLVQEVDGVETQIKNIIPFNYCSDVYNYSLKTSEGKKIYFGVGDWVLDVNAGVLTFYGDVPPGVDHNNPPKISFYQYIGGNGFRQDTVGYDGIILPITNWHISKDTYIIDTENDDKTLESVIKGIADKVEPGFSDKYGFDGADENVGIAYSFQKVIALAYTSSNDRVKGYDNSSNAEVGTLLSRVKGICNNENIKVTFTSNNIIPGEYNLKVEGNIISFNNGTAKSIKKGVLKLADGEDFIVIETDGSIEEGTYKVTVKETETYGILLYWDNKVQEYLPFKTNEDSYYNFGFPVVVANGKVPPSLALGSIVDSYSDSITPDYYGPRNYSVTIAEEKSILNKSADYVVRNTDSYYLDDILSQIIYDYTDENGDFNFTGSIFIRSGNYKVSDKLNLSKFTSLNIIGEDEATTVIEGDIDLGNLSNGLITIQNVTLKNINVNTFTQKVIISNVIGEDATLSKGENQFIVKDCSFNKVICNSDTLDIEESVICNQIVNSTIGEVDFSTGYTFVMGSTVNKLVLHDVKGDIIKGSFINTVYSKPAQTNVWDSTVINFEDTPFSQVPHMAHMPIYAKNNNQNIEYASFAAPFEVVYDSENGNKIKIKLDDEVLEIDDLGRLTCCIKANRITVITERLIRDNDYEGPSATEKSPDGNLQGVLEDIYATKADLNPNGKVPLEQLPDSISYGGLLLVGTWSFEVPDGDTYVDGGAYPTYEDAVKNLSVDKTQDEKLQPGWFWIVSASKIDEDKPATIQKAALQEGEEKPLEFTAGDWVIWNGSKFEKLDRAYQDVAYMVLPIYTTGEHLCWSWKDSEEGSKNGLGALALGGETIAEAFDKVNQELRKLWVKHPALLNTTVLEPFEDYKTITYFDVSSGKIQGNSLKVAYDIHKDDRVVNFRAKTPTTEPKWKSAIYIGDGCTFNAATDGVETSVNCVPSVEVNEPTIHISKSFDPYEGEMIGQGYWNAVNVDFKHTEEIIEGNHKFRLSMTDITPKAPAFINPLVGTDVLSFDAVNPKDFEVDEFTATVNPTRGINTDVLNKLLNEGICSGVRTINKDFTFKFNFIIQNAIDKVCNDGIVLKLYDECHDAYTDIPMGNMTFTVGLDGMYDITVSNFEYNFIVDKAYTEENFYIIVRDVYGHEKKIPTNLYDILKLNISKIDESERVYSGTGINPIYDSHTNGKCGYPYESYKNLETTNTNELMKMARNLENGETVYEYRWPDGRYSSIDGTLTDYTTVTNGDTIGEDVYRWVTITKFGKNSNLEPIVLNEASGFTMKFNIAEAKKDIWVEDKYSMTTENIIIQAKTFDPEKEGDQSNCSWVDCNSPYDGFAEVGTEDGQAGMYAGSSNATKKRVTFGKSTYSGKLAIRVGIKRTSNLSFESISIEDII